MPQLVEYSTAPARVLPVILLTDISGSMSVDGKIEALNSAVSEMIPSLAAESDSRVEINVAVITFGNDEALLHLNLTPSRDVKWSPLCAAGRTPLGAALRAARRVLDDRSIITSSSYRPAVVLISDGLPTDDWEQPLQELLSSERASKADRFAMAIGDDADMNVLQKFVGANGPNVFKAHEAARIRTFFKLVTMSVSMRSRQLDPNSVVSVNPDEINDNIEF